MSDQRRVLIVGSGKRVAETALPAFVAAEGFEVSGVLARKPKTLEAGGRRFEVEPLEALDAGRLAETDLLYVVVSKQATPQVLAQLRALGPKQTDLLIETPVLLFKHLGHLDLCRAFRSAWVSEDCTRLPWIDPVRAAFATGELGELKHAHFERSAFAYHGVALAKHLLQARVLRGRRTRYGTLSLRELRLSGGRSATMLEPRDYAAGRWTLVGSKGVLADHPLPKDGAQLLEPITHVGRCTGFRVGDHVRELDDAERELIGEPDGTSGMSAWMIGGKRVGFLTMLREIATGAGTYTLDEAVDDSVVDYHLDKFGRYLSNPVTHVRSGPGKLLSKALTRISGS